MTRILDEGGFWPSTTVSTFWCVDSSRANMTCSTDSMKEVEGRLISTRAPGTQRGMVRTISNSWWPGQPTETILDTSPAFR